MKTKIYLCKHCGKEYPKYNSTQKTCSIECLDKLNAQKDKEKRKIAREKKAVSVTALSDKADKLWSQVVRMCGSCEYCGKTESLNAHHIFGRTNKSVRWEVSNGICLCAGHHTFSDSFSAHKTPSEFTYWLEETRGKEYMQKLQELAHIPLKVTPEYLQEQIVSFKKILADNT